MFTCIPHIDGRASEDPRSGMWNVRPGATMITWREGGGGGKGKRTAPGGGGGFSRHAGKPGKIKGFG